MKRIKTIKTKQKKRFSIRYKMLIFLGLTSAIGISLLTFMSMDIARAAIFKKIEIHLKDKSEDTAKILDSRVETFFAIIETISNADFLKDKSLSFEEKAKKLRETYHSEEFIYLTLADTNGRAYIYEHPKFYVSKQLWFIKAMHGKRLASEPFSDVLTNNLIMAFSVPVYDVDDHTIIAGLNICVDGMWLTDQIKDIVVGTTGDCYILNNKGQVIANKNKELITNRVNAKKLAKVNKRFVSVANFETKAMSEKESFVGFYEYDGISNIAVASKMKHTPWTIITKAPIHEFMGTIKRMRKVLIIIGLIAFVLISALVLIVVGNMLRPIIYTVHALKDIAEGDGDLTVRLPVTGNNEMTDLSLYFNQTIQKINTSMQTVLKTSSTMREVATNLSSNMTETAGSINQINSNIKSVKEEILTQSTGVTETSATIEEIIRTIQSLDLRINHQVETLHALIEIIHESDKTTEKTQNILNKNDDLIVELANESSEGKNIISESEEEVNRILEESGSLMEAITIIHNISSQTNLLAMNAAIEAAHAGDAGRGFAVVADEIRKLAEESSMQAKVITEALKKLSSEIETVSQSSSNIGESFMSIFEKVNQVKNSSADIMEISKTRKEQSQKLLDLIDKIDGITNEVKDGSAEMLKGGEEVAIEMKKLDEMTHSVTDSMNQMASGAVQINNAIHEVSQLTQQNKESIQSLSDEVDKFKV